MKPIFAIAFLGLAACTSAVETSDPARAPAPAVEPAKYPHSAQIADELSGRDVVSGDRTSSIADVNGRTTAFVCGSHAFCEDFEQQSWESRWTDLVTTKGGDFRVDALSASTGAGALRLFAEESDSKAFLLQTPADVAARWSTSLAFAFRVDEVPSTYLGGPELTVKTVDGPVSLRVSMGPDGLALEQISAPACRRDRCEPHSTIIAPAQGNHWYHVSLNVNVVAQQGLTYGNIAVTVDGGEVQGSDLTVPFFGGSLSFRAGITQGDVRPAIALLDDVSLLIKQ